MPLTAANVLKLISEEDIYKKYISDNKFKLNTLFSSPFRDDSRPSFIIGDARHGFRYKDFATGESGNCFNFVSKIFGIDFNSTLIQIVSDFGIKGEFVINKNDYILTEKKADFKNAVLSSSTGDSCHLEVRLRKYEEHDYLYWNGFGITKDTLKQSRVYAISHYFINGVRFLAEKYAYVFVELKDNIVTYKVYQPFSKVRKWINNNNYSIWELWSNLPETGDIVIITSSRKDAMSIIESTGIPSVALQAETINPKETVLKELCSRFKQVFVFYDNDFNKEKNWGQLAAEKLITKYPELNLKNIYIDSKFNSKDYSDLVFNHKKTKASDELKKMINNA